MEYLAPKTSAQRRHERRRDVLTLLMLFALAASLPVAVVLVIEALR